jgi:TetR/AcrR family transcriptional repressor of nem operon
MAPKGNRTATLIELLRHGVDVVMKRGFQGAGLNDILQAAGVPRGSFYYYFQNKEDFGLHVIDYYAGFLFARLEDMLADESLSLLERLIAFFRESAREMEAEGFSDGSLIGILTQEMAGQSIVFREKLENVYDTLASQILLCLEEAARRGEVLSHLARREVADYIINSWEGAVLRAKAEHDSRPLALFERYVFGGLLGFLDHDRMGTMRV